MLRGATVRGMDEADLRNRFCYRPPGTEDRKLAHETVRGALLNVALLLNALLPDGREKNLMVTNLEYAMFWANASLARQGD